MSGETNPAILPPIVHRTAASMAEDFSVKLLAPWSSRGWALRPAQAERITYEPAYHDDDGSTAAPIEEVAMDLEIEVVETIAGPQLETATGPAGSFPWERAAVEPEPPADPPLSPWESFGQALKESVTWDGISIEEEAAPAPDPWAPAAAAWDSPETQSAPTETEDAAGGLDDIARRLEAFAAELRRVGYPAVTRALSGHRLEAAMASLVAGYVAASRAD